MSALRPITMITGASAGIGVELARVFARHGHKLALVARREGRLRALADEIAATAVGRPIVIVDDLAKPGAAARIRAALADHGAEPQFVVNNAGFGLVGRADTRDRAEQLEMIDLNVRTLTELSLAFVDSLERHKGGLLNVGSVAGFLPGPGSAVYYATKAFVLSFTEALHSELAARGVKGKMAPGLLVQTAQTVAEAGYRGLMRGQRTVVPGLGNKLVTLAVRFVPRRRLLRAVGARQSRRRAAQEA
jgi:short-subunit dehydrogenase